VSFNQGTAPPPQCMSRHDDVELLSPRPWSRLDDDVELVMRSWVLLLPVGGLLVNPLDVAVS